jgi:hypothetical protein
MAQRIETGRETVLFLLLSSIEIWVKVCPH